ncbi:hypothetical protein TSAR_005125 [Trichomalopsis sarcophagae]|uniref:Uncharacterized protein n=1 Tax=Trichomalopsis sarcophagae TaxID=543379 RepID=A0A232EHE6_9HYME|nr:hypothetical protein TSAR_005125 [Trichomalopsis sarcophagae]
MSRTLRNTYCRNSFFTNNPKYVKPVKLRLYCTNNNIDNSDKRLNDDKYANRIRNSHFFTQKNTLQLAVFQDGFEICNPLGASKGKFKMIGMYFGLFNLPPFLRFKINNIKLVLLYKEKYISQFSWHEIFK